MKNVIVRQNWRNCKLSLILGIVAILFGRCLIAKSLGISQLVHTFSNLNICNDDIQTLNSIVFKFIRKKKRDKTVFLSEHMFQLSTETCINPLKMKNKDYYRLLIKKEKIETKASTKWARKLQVDRIPMESFFSDIKTNKLSK